MKRILSVLLAGVLCQSICFANGFTTGQAADTVTFAKLEYGYSSMAADVEPSKDSKDYTLNKGKYGSKSEGYHFTSGKGTLYASLDGSSKRKLEWSDENYSCAATSKKEREPVMTAGNKNLWKAGSVPYFEMDVTTSGYENVSFYAYVAASKKGPKYYRVSYAKGNSDDFTVLSGSNVSLSDNKKMTKIGGKLPAALDNQLQIKLRVEICGLKTVDDSISSVLVNPTSGEVAINHISLQGKKKENTSVDSKPSTNNSPASSSTNASSTTKKKVTGISYAMKKVRLKKGQKKTMYVSVKVTPATVANVNAVKKKLTYKSSNPKIVYVSKTGKLKAKKKGTVKITVRYSKKIKTSYKVIVK